MALGLRVYSAPWSARYESNRQMQVISKISHLRVSVFVPTLSCNEIEQLVVSVVLFKA